MRIPAYVCRQLESSCLVKKKILAKIATTKKPNLA